MADERHGDSTTTDGEPVEVRRRSPRVRVRAKMDAGAPAAAVRRSPWASEDSDEEDSECEAPRCPPGSPRPAAQPAVDPSLDPGYVRLQEEHIEPSVVVLQNGGVSPAPWLDTPKVGGGKLTFNLTPEQLGSRNAARRPSPHGPIACAPPGDAISPERSLSLGGASDGPSPRKSSLRRSSGYSNQSEGDRQLQLVDPQDPALQLLPGCSGLLYDGPRTAATGKLTCLGATNELHGSSGSVSPSVDRRGSSQRAARPVAVQANKFDEISTIYDHFPTDFLPEKYLCGLCRKLLREPRVLDCLHTFCRTCLARLASMGTHGSASALFWNRIDEGSTSFDVDPATGGGVGKDAETASAPALNNHEAAVPVSPEPGATGGGESRFGQLRSSFQSFREQHCLRSPVRSEKEKVRARVMCDDREKVLVCPTCKQPSELPAGPGGVSQLPQHFVLARKIENIIFQHGAASATSRATPSPAPGSTVCELCSDQVTATAHCQTCSVPLCNFCKEAHHRQRSTASHCIVRLGLRWPGRPTSIGGGVGGPDGSLQCPMHPEQQLKLFCTTCHQVSCGECSVLLHAGHRCTTVARAGRVYGRFVRGAIEQTRPLEEFAAQQAGRLEELAGRVDGRCEAVQREVDAFVEEYVAALEEHRKALAAQIGDIRRAKTDMIRAQKLDLERRSQNARAAIEFAEELLTEGSDVENLVFVSILLKRFEQCLKPARTLDRTVTDTVQFLADEEAPSARVQTGVPLFGIVTTQAADPRQSALEHAGGELAALKAHRRVQLRLVVRDFEGRRLAHGGITVQADLRFRDDEDHSVAVSVADNRDGSYALSFVPPRAGVMHLMLSVDGKMIEECPIALRIHKLRPHYGVYHCCTFCSSSGSKASTCACGSVMPGGYRGCGHGHDGHPGHRHWSCCGSLHEHSDCTGSRAGRK